MWHAGITWAWELEAKHVGVDLRMKGTDGGAAAEEDSIFLNGLIVFCNSHWSGLLLPI